MEDNHLDSLLVADQSGGTVGKKGWARDNMAVVFGQDKRERQLEDTD